MHLKLLAGVMLISAVTAFRAGEVQAASRASVPHVSETEVGSAICTSNSSWDA